MMPAYYFDSSGIAKRYATKTGSSWVRSIVAEDENTIIIAEIGTVEVAAAFAKMPLLTFVAADEDLLEAAEAEGLVTENPNLYV
jgi:predicted nucleic acid-binding protein